MPGRAEQPDIPPALREQMRDHLAFLYSRDRLESIWARLVQILAGFRGPRRPRAALDEGDTVLITYGDQFRERGPAGERAEPPLRTLHRILTGPLSQGSRPVVSGVHLLPFFPYSSDDGFSIIDYTRVNPDMGAWHDVEGLGQDFRLMFDLVLNHVSRESEWFQRFLAGDPGYRDWFITVDPDEPRDWVEKVVRPRARPLLTPVETAWGKTLVWTTFSEDQIDLNYAHPPVLLRMIEILLLYVEKGAEIIRLDAIAYLWKERGTSCLHLEETHRVVKLFRSVLDAVAPGTVIITETNVPHEENISYFGDGSDEAHLVYNFSLPPLTMHSLLTGDAQVLSGWAAGLETPSDQTTFFNFTASHDGIGVTPARGLLSADEIQALVDATEQRGGFVSYKAEADGSRSVYELNISYVDAVSDPALGNGPAQVARFMVSQAIMLSLAGVPGIYVHSLIGSRSWRQGVEQTGRTRTINREKLERGQLEQELADAASLRSQVLDGYHRLLGARRGEPAFHPQGAQQVLQIEIAVFCLLRISPDGHSHVLCAHNVSGQSRRLLLDPESLGLPAGTWRDLLSGSEYLVESDGLELALPPYGVQWLKV